MLRKGLSILVMQRPSGINRESLIKQFLKISSKISYFAKATVSRLFTVFKNKTGKIFSIIRSRQIIIIKRRNLIVEGSIFKSKVHIGTFSRALGKKEIPSSMFV